MLTFKSGETFFLQISVLDLDGNFVSGLSISYEIRKLSDLSLVLSGNMNEVNNHYYTSGSLTTANEYIIYYTTPTSYQNGSEYLIIKESPSELEILIKRVLGLSQENYRIFAQLYDENGNLLIGIIKIYNNKSDCNNDINSLHQYTITATYNNDETLNTYKVVKE